MDNNNVSNKQTNNTMKAYLRNIKEAWKIYKDGRWPSNSMNIYRFIFKYTLKYIQRNVVLNYLNKN